MIDYLQDAVRQLTFVSCILACFAFAVVMHVMRTSKPRRLATAIIALLSSAAFCLLALTIIGLVLGWVIPTIPDLYPGQATVAKTGEMAHFTHLLLYVFFLALAAFMSGIALYGWLHSRVVGWLSVLTGGSVGLGLVIAYLYITHGLFS
jgi:hypothetical protein